MTKAKKKFALMFVTAVCVLFLRTKRIGCKITPSFRGFQNTVWLRFIHKVFAPVPLTPHAGLMRSEME